MEIKSTAKDLSKMFKTIGKLNKEVVIKAVGNELCCIVSDSGLCSIIDYKMKVATVTEGTLSVNIEKLDKIIKRFDGVITLSAEKDIVTITDGSKVFNIPQISVVSEERIPVLTFSCMYAVDDSILSKIIEDSWATETDTTEFDAEGDTLIVRAGHEEIKMQQKVVCEVKTAAKKEVAKMATELVENIIGIVDKLYLEIMTDCPLKITGENDNIKLMCMIAPRVDSG